MPTAKLHYLLFNEEQFRSKILKEEEEKGNDKGNEERKKEERDKRIFLLKAFTGWARCD